MNITDQLVVDNFAGGGGASVGMEQAIGRPVDIAINHSDAAIAMHKANHPRTKHFCQSIMSIDPIEATGNKPVFLAWFSPDCKHHSKAKGGKPREKRIRDLAWIVVHWAERLGANRPWCIMLENVEEFRHWGPLDAENQPIKERRGEEFDLWVRRLKRCGYTVEWKEQIAADYGAPTSRKRLFLIARRDGRPIVWPEPSHGPGRIFSHRIAGEIIDWSIPCPSIFERKRPLADKTLARIATGIHRFVLDTPAPFIVPVTHTKDGARCNPSTEPLRTITTAKGGEFAVVAPYFARTAHGDGPAGHRPGGRTRALSATFPTITAKGDTALISPTLIQTGYGERVGQAPRCLDLKRPLGTIVAGGGKHALACAFMAQHNGGRVGRALNRPLSTIVHRGTQQQLVTSNLLVLRNNGSALPGCRPLPTITAGGYHFGEVRATLTKYYGGGGGTAQSLHSPLHTISTRGRFGLVTTMIGINEYAISDIGMRMLSPRELFNAQGFPRDYIIDPEFNGKPLTKTKQVEMCGNSVSPVHPRALILANYPELAERHGALRETAVA